MKGFLSQKQVETIKEQYPVGTRIELIHMDDPYGPIKPGRREQLKAWMTLVPCICDGTTAGRLALFRGRISSK